MHTRRRPSCGETQLYNEKQLVVDMLPNCHARLYNNTCVENNGGVGEGDGWLVGTL